MFIAFNNKGTHIHWKKKKEKNDNLPQKTETK